MKILVDRTLLERILVGADQDEKELPAWLTAELAAAIEAGAQEEEARRIDESLRQTVAGAQLKDARDLLAELREIACDLARAACKIDPHSCGGSWCMLRVRARQLLAEQGVEWRRGDEVWKELAPADRVQLVALHAKQVTGSQVYAELVARALQGWLNEPNQKTRS